MASLSYPLFFSLNTVPVIPITIWVKETTNFCISLRIYLWKMPCGKCWKWHCRETKFRNFLEEHPSLKCLQRSNFSSRAYTLKISCYSPVTRDFFLPNEKAYPPETGIIEDEFHFLFHCPKYSIPREKFYNQIQQNFVDFNQLSYTELIIKLMNSQNFSVNSHLLKFVSLCNDLRTNLLSNHADDVWLTVVIIALHYHCYKL